jgi:hypothetical protein
MYCFFHAPEKRIVYRCRSAPEVTELRDRRKLIGCRISRNVVVTRADNWPVSANKWHLKVLDIREQEFDYPRYTSEQAVSWFLVRNSPANWKTVEVVVETYVALEAEYSAIAAQNRPAG